MHKVMKGIPTQQQQLQPTTDEFDIVHLPICHFRCHVLVSQHDAATFVQISFLSIYKTLL